MYQRKADRLGGRRDTSPCKGERCGCITYLLQPQYTIDHTARKFSWCKSRHKHSWNC
ncbi:hypothetical protein BDR03DRAFT_975857 [Suillus americanus]|nr:hypothetical protein BDR03DRAFT_975857 [Suillus americanus]